MWYIAKVGNERIKTRSKKGALNWTEDKVLEIALEEEGFR